MTTADTTTTRQVPTYCYNCVAGPDLLSVKARGGDVRIVYSPLDAVDLARAHPTKQVVFFAVGFETTAPGNAMAVWRARQLNVPNFSILVSHVTVPPAMTAILAAPDNRVQGFLAAGHVCAVMGWKEYEPIAAQYKVPIIVTGFEPVDLMTGILMCVQALERGEAKVENAYKRSAGRDGNPAARALFAAVHGIVTLALDQKLGRSEHRDAQAQVRFVVSAVAAGLLPASAAFAGAHERPG